MTADVRGFWKRDPAIHLEQDGTSFAINVVLRVTHFRSWFEITLPVSVVNSS